MAKINFLKIVKMAKGINIFSRDTMLTDEESVEGINIRGVGQYSIAKRDGTVKLTEIEGVGQVDGMGTYYTTSGVRHLLAMAGGKLWRVDTGTAIEIAGAGASFTPGQRTDFCQAGANVYISNGVDTMRHYNGSEVLVTTNGIVAKHIIYHKGGLYAIGNASYGSRLYRSGIDDKIGDFTYNASTNPYATSIYLSNNDGQDCTSLFKHQDYLYVAKNKTIYRTSESMDANATITQELVDPARGADSHWATDAVENDIFFFNEEGVHSMGYEPNYLNQIRTKIISLRVDRRIKTMSKDALKYACGIYFGNDYFFAYRQGGATANNSMLIYDKYRTGWWEYSLAANCFAEFKNQAGATRLYFGSSTDGSVYYFDSTVKADNGEKIKTKWKSPKYSISDYTQSKFVLNILLYMGKRIGTITVSVFIDGKLINTKTVATGFIPPVGTGIDTIGTETIGVGAISGEERDLGGSDIIILPVNKMGRNIQVVIEEESSSRSWEINAMEIAMAKLNKLYQPNVK